MTPTARRLLPICVAVLTLLWSDRSDSDPAERGRNADLIEVEVAGATFRVHGMGVAGASPRATWTRWLRASAGSVAGIAGRFPVDEVVVRLQPDSRSGAVGFGRVERGTPPTIVFDVRPDASLEELRADWRGYHEMAHMLIPFPGNRDIWFSEGLASYYQYFLMARAGELSVDAAWRAFARGLLRGVDDRGGRGQTLRQLAPRMWDQRAFRRVYWTGAAYFLNVDIALRRASEGRLSVDHALAEFQRCCRREWGERTVGVDRLIDRFGDAGRADIWRSHHRRLMTTSAEPAFDQAFDALGITIGPHRRIRLDDDLEAVRLREAIALGNSQVAE